MNSIYCYKKIFWLILGLMTIHISGHSQSQKQKYIQGLIKSIALYQSYISRLKKGYDIVKKGLNIIHDIKNGEFSLHKDYFSGLDNVNPAIKRYAKVSAIIAFQYEIILKVGKMKAWLTGNGISSPEDVTYIHGVLDRLLEDVSQNLEALSLVISDGKVKMTDDERIKRIDNLYVASANNYNFLMNFSQQIRFVEREKKKSVDEGKVMMELQGVSK